MFSFLRGNFQDQCLLRVVGQQFDFFSYSTSPLFQDYNDEIRQAQLQELTYLNGGSETAEVPVVRGKASIRARGVPVPALSRYVEFHLNVHISSFSLQTQFPPRVQQ